MDGSRRSSKSNAFFTGFGKNRRIVLFDTLIARHTIEELVSVLAHEMGHYKKKHILKSMILGILQSGIMFYLFPYLFHMRGCFMPFISKMCPFMRVWFFSACFILPWPFF
jgi:STE24 endopeptidase